LEGLDDASLFVGKFRTRVAEDIQPTFLPVKIEKAVLKGMACLREIDSISKDRDLASRHWRSTIA
jgi:hypothetical protein